MQPASAPSIQVRDLRFKLDAVPKHWHGGRRSVTLFFDNLSVFFPPGERFFVAAVKAFQQKVTDEKLAADVAAFCGQEGHHSREHVRYNKMLEEQGYPAQKLEKRVANLLKVVTRRASKSRQLAATCALEHFTSLMGTLVLENPRTLEGAHPELAALWRWHAAEENEHKSVAFDVFKAIGGSYFRRAFVMFTTTIVFWAMVFVQQVELMRADGILFSPREWFALFRFLFLEPGGMAGLFRPYLSYYRPSFHPSEHDTRELVERWVQASL
ncbi:MAG: metal-dependent hydrolase [Myxococcaceae bacterium]